VSKEPAQNPRPKGSSLDMAIHPIRAVLFDMGGTLEDLYYDDTVRREATRGLRELLLELQLDPGLSLPDLGTRVLAGIGAYQAWRETSQVELPPERVWAEYVFPNHGVPRERLMAAAEEIAFFYETHYYRRSLRPEAPAVLAALHGAGFRLGIISNIISRTLVQHKLVEYGIAQLLEPVVTSSNFGRRKPDARIFEEAARLMPLPPGACAYVGDTISRDVAGARRAGYGMAIQIRSFLTEKADGSQTPPGAACVPDAVIHDLGGILPLVRAHAEALRGP
jgi:putative hydrolase of the HAD superfamily